MRYTKENMASLFQRWPTPGKELIFKSSFTGIFSSWFGAERKNSA